MRERARRSCGALVRAIKDALNGVVPRSISTALFPRRPHVGARARSFRCCLQTVKSVPTMPALKCCSSDRLARAGQGYAHPSNAVRVRRQAIAALQHQVSARLGDQRCAQLRRCVGECMLVSSFGPLPSFKASAGAMARQGGWPVTESASVTSAALALTTSCSRHAALRFVEVASMSMQRLCSALSLPRVAELDR
jgi:hypothetical protein